MKIKFITSFATDRQSFNGSAIHDVTDDQALELIRLGIATVDAPAPKIEANVMAEIAAEDAAIEEAIKVKPAKKRTR